MKKDFIILFVVIVLIVGLWSLNYYEVIDLSFLQKIVKQTETEETSDLSEVFSVVGKVEAINSNSFTLRASQEQNQLGEEKVFDVNVTDKTTFSGLDMPKSISQGDILKPIFSNQKQFSDLAVGDEVVATSEVNLLKVDSFTAVSAQIIK